MTQRIGFACKYMHPDQTLAPKLLEEKQRPLNTKGTTKTWLGNQRRTVAEDKLREVMMHNLRSAFKLVDYVSKLKPELRMVRLSSDLMPFYTEPSWSYFYQDPVIQAEAARLFALVGDHARKHDVRLSFHPGQFTVLASDNDDIVDRSIDEFEYHVDMARWMGYGQKFQDFKINVHISGRRGPAGIRAALSRMSPEARNTITIENDENRWGIEHSLDLAKDCALVLDIHHHWCREGEYIQRTDPRYQRMIESWRGVRPVIHYSYSRDEHLAAGGYTSHQGLPDRDQLIANGAKKAKLRAHSDRYPNLDANQWALSFLENADIMCESKHKNLASIELSKQR